MKIIIASLRFAPGHIAHLIAYYRMCTEMGYQTKLLLDPKYIDFLEAYDMPMVTTIEQAKTYAPDVVLSYNTGKANLGLAKAFRGQKCKLLYVFHEPFPGWKEIVGEKENFVRSMARIVLDSMICSRFDKILLPSKTAVKNYWQYERIFNKNYTLFPLIFPDEYEAVRAAHPMKRQYFSFIGGFSSTHGSDHFIKLIQYAYENGLDTKFKLATRSDVSELLKYSIIQKMISDGRLAIQYGRPMTTEEINIHYLESIAVWNVYNKSTQSGVLCNAFMMGAPVIATRVGSFEDYVQNGYNGFLISEPNDMKTLCDIYLKCVDNRIVLEQGARETFLQRYYYRSHARQFSALV